LSAILTLLCNDKNGYLVTPCIRGILAVPSSVFSSSVTFFSTFYTFSPKKSSGVATVRIGILSHKFTSYVLFIKVE